MAKGAKVTVDHVFAFVNDADLNAQIAAFRAASEKTRGQRLAMDARRPLGPGKVRVTFRVVSARS